MQATAVQPRKQIPVASWVAASRWLLLLALLTLTAGCAEFEARPRPAPVTVSEVIRLSHKDVAAKEIIRRMRAAGTVYRLDAGQLARLHDQGVADAVINYMQRTYLRAVRRREARAERHFWSMGDDGYWYGFDPDGDMDAPY
ncbi:MAG: hypothetical protein P8076_15035 [Gammaproteobacteria bacterium]